MRTSTVPSGTLIVRISSVFILAMFTFAQCTSATTGRKTESLDKNWRFWLGELANGQRQALNDSRWDTVDLPHDWSIEGAFSEKNPATPGGGALPGGIGWYRKSFTIPESEKGRLAFVEFDGVYRNSEVWINGHSLGVRPYGYSSFEYELTPFLHYGDETNLLAVRVDNSEQPNSRWYSGSGIYRHVWLTTTAMVRVDHWGTCITTPAVTQEAATVVIRTNVQNADARLRSITMKTMIVDARGVEVAHAELSGSVARDSVGTFGQILTVTAPSLWSVDHPSLYRAITHIESGGTLLDSYETSFGIRTFAFNVDKGFSLNGTPIKIKGVCNHHDLGCLGSAVNTRAIERQLEMLKAMGANAIRTSHNPPAPELLELCDKLGFIVMDEAFDMWKKGKTKYDYSLNWDAWHRRDLTDMVMRDRNHPSVFLWSIGNEVTEQWDKNDSTGTIIARELAGIVKSLDPTRPITANCNDISPLNPVIRSDALDVIGYSYNHNDYHLFPSTYPGKKLIGSETTSALETRGHYDMPSDSVRRWPTRWDLPLTTGNIDNTCSAYDNCSAPWGGTHEEALKLVKKFDFVAGMFIWTGFDYLGEPTPYPWPSRSSYFGIIDLAGFPKDVYSLYQSEWTDKPVLHLLPHWNWKSGQAIDVWAYTNCDEVELFLNGTSLGVKKKSGDDLHLAWRVNFVPGTLKAVGRSKGKNDLVREVRTAGTAAKIELEADRSTISANGDDLSFVTAKVLDAEGTIVPQADNQIHFTMSGAGSIAGVDNGLQTSLEPMKANEHKSFNGRCLAVVRSTEKPGAITLSATSDGLSSTSITIESR